VAAGRLLNSIAKTLPPGNSESLISAKSMRILTLVLSAAALPRGQERPWQSSGSCPCGWRYCGQAEILRRLERLEEALALFEKQEQICLKLDRLKPDRKDGLQRWSAQRALFLHMVLRSEEGLALLQKQETICLELDAKGSLQLGYHVKAMILMDLGRLEETVAVLRKQELVCLELGLKNALAYCYMTRGKLAGELHGKVTEKQKYGQALAIFAKLKILNECDVVRAALHDIDSV
jgi:tetratricopeptide (TPR) repeat protein